MPINSSVNFVENNDEVNKEDTAELLIGPDEDSVSNRQRKAVFLADERDEEMQEFEATASWCAKWGPALMFIPFNFLGNIGAALIKPQMPTVFKKEFGSDEKAAEIQSYVLVASALLGLVTCSLYGKIIDTFGRKWMIVLFAIVNNALPQTLLAIFPEHALYYMIAAGAGQIVQASVTGAYLADLYSTSFRVKVFAMRQCIGSLTAFFAIFGNVFSERLCFAIAAGCGWLSVLYAAVVFRETLPQAVKDKYKGRGLAVYCENPLSGIKHLLSTRINRAVITIFALYLFAQIGTGDIYMYYLNSRIKFDKQDMIITFMCVGAMAPIVQLGVLPFLAKRLSPTMIIVIALVALVVELVLIATVWAVWVVWVLIVPLVELTMMMVPMLLTVISNCGSQAELGLRQSGVQALTDLMNALGPLFFGMTYSNVPPSISWLPFLIAGLLAIPVFFVALRLQGYIDEDNDKKIESASASREASANNRSAE